VPTKETVEPGELDRHMCDLLAKWMGVGKMDGIYPSDDGNMVSASIFRDPT
jgi:hypothetical protein